MEAAMAYVGVLFKLLCKGIEKTHNTPQLNWKSQSWVLNLGPPKHEARIQTTLLQWLVILTKKKYFYPINVVTINRMKYIQCFGS
jgi:hypothetical protein